MSPELINIILKPKFIEVLLYCAKNKELVSEFDRLTQSNLSLKGSTIDKMIDNATGKLDEDIVKFILFVDNAIYSRVIL